MESVDIKVCKMQARKVAQDVLMFVWFKHGVIPEKPTPELSFVPEITAEFLNNLCVLVWIESSCNDYVWGDFLKNHFERMTKTPYLFATYFAYASYVLIEEAKDAHACFVDILSLVTHFALHCWQEEEEEEKFLNSCVDLFCEFFDKELCKKFEEQGRWKNFNEYLKNQGSLKRYKELICANKPPNEIFKEFLSKHQESNEPYVINNVVLENITEYEVESNKKAANFANSVGDKMKEVYNKAFEEVLKDFPKIDNQVEELYRETVGEASGGMTSATDQSSSQEVQEDSLGNVPNEANLDKDQSKEVEGHKAFEEVLKDFPKTDNREEKLYRETVEVASGGMTSATDQSSSQEVQEDSLENILNETNPERIEDRMKDGKAFDPLETPVTDSLKSLDLSPVPQESDPIPKLTKAQRAKVLLKKMMVDIANISELIKFVCEENAIKVQIQVLDTVSKL